MVVFRPRQLAGVFGPLAFSRPACHGCSLQDMKQTLQLRLSQHLALTPQLQQSIRLLQLSTLDLQQELETILNENPMLERDEPEDAPAMLALGPAGTPTEASQEEPARSAEDVEAYAGAEGESDWSDVGRSRRDDDDDEPGYGDFQAAAGSLRDHLMWQLGLTPLSERDRALVEVLIEALDDDGYLTQTLDEILSLFEPEQEVTLEDLQIAMLHLQHFDPAGVGARTAQECLALQLEGEGDEDDPIRALALAIVKQHLELLAARDFTRLRRALNCTDDALREAHLMIKGLNPRPGAQYAPVDARYIVPDVIVRKVRERWTVNLNPEAMPRLRINRLYADLLHKQRGSGLSAQLQEAKWLIKNVQQRFDTILRVSQAIVERQRQYFEHGEVAMRPLTLREIAEELGLHESTISRVTTQKYMATPRGILELKFFFGSHVSTDAGGACSSTAIRALIKQLVAAEDTKSPLTDSRIAEILGQQGINVARRTIAKYREALNISPVNLRKSI